MDELKPCPFCGGTNIVMRDVSGLFGKSAYTRTYHYMQCRDCMSQTGYHGTKPKTIEAWNKRVPQTVVNQHGENGTFKIANSDIGKTVFYNREDAERMLRRYLDASD